ncbi:MAG TPA: hydantoinase/oxoprolinase family protein [Solirubrobacteraceae bacterium]|nr:hydantoinase/oxoprolinase family protein [Solirubrobacteraceae bacterium]
MGQAASASLTIDIDTGGTFTDGYFGGSHGGLQVKTETTPHDLTEGIMACIDRGAELLGMGRRELLATADTVRLSTTVGTNALLTRSGPKIGLLLGRSLHDELAPALPQQVPITTELIEAVPEKQDPNGATLRAVRRLLERGARVLLIALDGEDLAVWECAMRERIADEYPRHYLGAVPVLGSHQVSRTPNAGARVRTAVLNAYLHPLMSRFLYRIEDELRREGHRRPLLIANADGGTSRVAKTTAIRTWGSGPAGGVAGAAHLAGALGSAALVTLDVGGTSSDIALLRDGRWRYVVEPTIDGAQVAVPLLELESIGVGGGSIVQAVEEGVRVGPQSAGAQPGPAAFGLGGEQPTLTDAFCCVGVFDPECFLGGRKRLDVAAAERALQPLAQALGTDVPGAGEQAIAAAAHTIAQGILALLDRHGTAPADTELLAGGGAGGLLGCLVAAAAGLDAVRAFALAPVFSAYGLSALDRMHGYELDPDAGELAGAVDELLDRARADMRSEGVALEELRCELEIETGPDGAVRAEPLGEVRTGTESAKLIGAAGEPARLVRVRARAPGRPRLPEAPSDGEPGPGERTVRLAGTDQPVPVRGWSSLRAGECLAGPLVLEGIDTTSLLPPGFAAVAGEHGDLLIHREA